MYYLACLGQAERVALLAEGVDRNIGQYIQLIKAGKVALLAEGVDRNTLSRQAFINDDMSPSSRRAWIEISH